MKIETKDWGFLVTLAAIWGLSFPVVSLALESLPPATTVMGRMLLAAAGMLVLVIATRREFPKDKRALINPALVGLIGNGVPFTLITWGQEAIGASLAGILMAIMPLTTLVLAHFFSAGERLRAAGLVGFAVGFVGIVILMGPEALKGLGNENLIRQVAVLGGALCFAVSALIARRSAALDPWVSTLVAMVSGSCLMLPVSLLNDAPWTLSVSATSWGALIYLGVLGTAVGNVLYFTIAQRTGASFLALINYLIPCFAVLLSFILLSEVPAWSSLGALALILGGVFLSQRGQNKSQGSGIS